MGRAEDIFHRLMDGGDQAVQQLVNDRESEHFWLDFKGSRSDGSGIALHDDDRHQLAKAISRFGNSDGGVIMWGVVTRRGTYDEEAQ